MRHRSSSISYFLISAICLALFVNGTMAACNQSQRQDTLHASVVAVTAASDGFSKWDRAHQDILVRQAVDRDSAIKAITEYRVTQQKIADGIMLAYRTLAVASTQNDDPSLTAAIVAAQQIIDDIDKLRKGGQ
ncbi:MAG: hypothetical protein WA418_24550 [Bradyrhizobium sp.]